MKYNSKACFVISFFLTVNQRWRDTNGCTSRIPMMLCGGSERPHCYAEALRRHHLGRSSVVHPHALAPESLFLLKIAAWSWRVLKLAALRPTLRTSAARPCGFCMLLHDLILILRHTRNTRSISVYTGLSCPSALDVLLSRPVLLICSCPSSFLDTERRLCVGASHC